MPAYIIASQRITDPETFGKYAQAVGPTVAAHGGKVLTAGDAEVLEGNPDPMTVVIEFESVEKAKAWYNSSEYQAIIGLRHESTTGWAVLGSEFVPPQS